MYETKRNPTWVVALFDPTDSSFIDSVVLRNMSIGLRLEFGDTAEIQYLPKKTCNR